MATRRVFLYAAALLVGAVSSCRAAPASAAVPALDSISPFDSSICAYAEERFRIAPRLKADASGGDSEATKLRSRPLRASASGAGFVDVSVAVPFRSIMAAAEEVFDRVSVAGGILVMGLSMVLP